MSDKSAPVFSHDLCAANTPQRRSVLRRWVDHGWLRPLDVAFAEFLSQDVPDAPPLLRLAAALASHQLGRGHACLDLAATLRDPAFALSLPPEGSTTAETDDPPPNPAEVLDGLTLSDWQAALEHPELVNSGIGHTPLVRVGTRLYLRRYWVYERTVIAAIQARLKRSEQIQITLPTAAIRQILDGLFPSAPRSGTASDWQKLACALAARSAFSILTGGPGTGKTTTVIKLLALLQALALADPNARTLRIRLAAPTGKAAARLNASIAGTIARLPLDALGAAAEQVRKAIPVTVTTLHRLLGRRPDTRRPRYHAGQPLALDVLVIDEASMIDLEMMAAVLDALPPSSRLILLGDKDQLASVEAGAVLGELCQRAAGSHYSPMTADWLAAATGERIDPKLITADATMLDQSIVMLRHSYRFPAGSGIGQLAAAVNAGDTKMVSALARRDFSDLALIALDEDLEQRFRALVIEGQVATSADPIRHGYRHYLQMLRDHQPAPDADLSVFDAWARDVLKAHAQFQVLCAVRRGVWGVEGLNQRIARLLADAGLIPASSGWYSGRPVLVTRNDYALGLMNGDIGITLPAPGTPDMLRVAFADGQGGIQWILPSRLQSVETVYALTVHKSQGSEFAHAALILPASLSPILTRELIYTGITRASACLTLVQTGRYQVLAQAVTRRVLRASGLMEKPL